MWHQILSMQARSYQRTRRPDLTNDDVWKMLLHCCHNLINRYGINDKRVTMKLYNILNAIRLEQFKRDDLMPDKLVISIDTETYYIVVDEKDTPITIITEDMFKSDRRNVEYNLKTYGSPRRPKEDTDE